MKVLILGSTGQLGKSVTLKLYDLLRKGIVTKLGVCFRKRPKDFIENKKAVFFNFDINDREKIDELFQDQSFDIVINLLHDTSKTFNLDKNFHKRILKVYDNIFRIVEYIKPRRIIFSSSGAVYEGYKIRKEGFKEDDINLANKPYLLTNYANSKIYFEKKMLEWKEKDTNRSYLIFRLFSVYGSDSRKDTKHAFTEFVDHRRKGKDIALRSPDTERSFLHLDDLARWVLELLNDNRDLIINFGSDNHFNIYDLAKKISSISCKYKKVGLIVENERINPTKYFCNNAYRKSLGLVETRKFDDALIEQIND